MLNKIKTEWVNVTPSKHAPPETFIFLPLKSVLIAFRGTAVVSQAQVSEIDKAMLSVLCRGLDVAPWLFSRAVSAIGESTHSAPVH